MYVNGVKVEMNTARVSAYPFNRRWPGHQRQIEQMELINFLSMESDEEVELKIIPKIPSFTTRIRPRSLEAKAQTDANGVITVRVNGSVQKPYFSFVGDNPNSTCEEIRLENVLWNGEPISQELFEKQTHRNEFAKNIKLIQK